MYFVNPNEVTNYVSKNFVIVVNYINIKWLLIMQMNAKSKILISVYQAQQNKHLNFFTCSKRKQHFPVLADVQMFAKIVSIMLYKCKPILDAYTR